MDRYYSFKIVTYNPLSYVQAFISHTKNYAYILHDKDTTDSHFHLLATFTSNKSFNSIKTLMGGDQNTFVQPLKDKYGDFLYLTHKNAPEKFQYSDDLIVSNNLKFFTDTEKAVISNEEFLNDISPYSLLSYRDLAVKYGRDYIKNYKAYHSFAYEALKQQQHIDLGYKEELTFITYPEFLIDLYDSLALWARDFIPDLYDVYTKSFYFFKENL